MEWTPAHEKNACDELSSCNRVLTLTATSAICSVPATELTVFKSKLPSSTAAPESTHASCAAHLPRTFWVGIQRNIQQDTPVVWLSAQTQPIEAYR